VTGDIRSVGAQLQPGAAFLLLGVPCDELAERHIRLDDLWGRAALEMRERLAAEPGPERQLELVESMLAARLPRLRGLHPAVADAVARFAVTSDVGGVVAASGYSHRHFIALFSQAVGLAPKRYCRVRRFQDVLHSIIARRTTGWADLALGSGYCDQPHFNREFRALTGVSPGEYRRLAPRLSHHLPIL
jgi:AraC-like DNA-binding protein